MAVRHQVCGENCVVDCVGNVEFVVLCLDELSREYYEEVDIPFCGKELDEKEN